MTHNLYSFLIKEIFEREFKENLNNLLDELKKGDLKKYFKDRIQKKDKDINQWVRANLEKFRKIYENNLEKLIKTKNYIKILVKARLTENSRLAINTSAGWGNEVFEVGIHIHPIYSIPFIPGSSIKGALRRAYWRVGKLIIKEDKETKKIIELVIFGTAIKEDEERWSFEKIEVKKLKKLFNYGKIRKFSSLKNEDTTIDRMVGSVIFLDAYPFKITESGDIEVELENGIKEKIGIDLPDTDILKLDVINKHYDDSTYFQGDALKQGEYIDPNPIIFYTIKERIPFTFLFLVDKEIWQNDIVKTAILSSIIYTFEVIGLCAKTTYGYGRFKVEKIWVIKN